MEVNRCIFMKAKSLNDISNQEDRLLKMNREMVAAGWWINRSEIIKRAARNSRAARGLSIFSKNRDEKK